MRILIASNNQGKLREYRTLLAALPFELTTPDQEGLTIQVEERGTTFEENAILKARAYATASNVLTLADDSGLEVDALGGAPGIFSARYAGAGAGDEIRYRKLLDELRHLPMASRRARFRCVIALALPHGKVITTEGTCEGVIAREPRGEHGFGYDPVFYLPALRCTMAELQAELKDRVSHRGRAAMRIRTQLQYLLEE